MEEYRINNAIVRIHNEPNQEKIKTATVAFLKKVQQKKRREQKKNVERHQ